MVRAKQRWGLWCGDVRKMRWNRKRVNRMR